MCVLGVRRAREPGWIRATWECCRDTKVLLWDQITLLCCQNRGGAAILPGAESSGCTGSPCRTPRPRVLEGTLDSDKDVADERGSSKHPGKEHGGLWRSLGLVEGLHGEERFPGRRDAACLPSEPWPLPNAQNVKCTFLLLHVTLWPVPITAGPGTFAKRRFPASKKVQEELLVLLQVEMSGLRVCLRGCGFVFGLQFAARRSGSAGDTESM